MTKEEYKKLVSEEELKHEKALSQIRVAYALSNNPYKEGDVVEDHIGKGRIKKIKVSRTFSGEPCCVYICDNLTKSGEVSKREPERRIWQFDIKKG